VKPADPSSVSLVIGAASLEVRRALGPSAWLVFEEMLLRSTPERGERIAHVSVRSMAAALGVAKDTVARALKRLRDAGLVTPAQPKNERGLFEAGSYVIDVPEGLTVSAMELGPQARTRKAAPDIGQLTLAIES
jgi:DNA-binding transcriptional ArsR family regulator